MKEFHLLELVPKALVSLSTIQRRFPLRHSQVPRHSPQVRVSPHFLFVQNPQLPISTPKPESAFALLLSKNYNLA